MNLFLRLVGTVLGALARPPLDRDAESVVDYRVWPTDLDINGHMTNARYLAVMDLGRTDLVVRMGMLPLWLKRRWRPLVGSAQIRFLRSLRPFSTYQLRSRMVYWNAKWFFIEQHFEQDGVVVATALVKGLVRGPEGNVSPADMFSTMGMEPEPPHMPDSVRLWMESDDAMGRASVRRG